jgi:hypothetical protein
MALKRKGEDPKTKVKVTSVKEDVKPNAENKRKMDEYNAASASYKSAESKYKSDVDAYNKQMKAYNEAPRVAGRRDMETTFQGPGKYLTGKDLEDWNAKKSEGRGGVTAKKVYVSKNYNPDKEYTGYFHEDLNKPTAPVKQKTPTVERPKLAIERMPLNKVTGVSTEKKQLAVPKEKEKWQAPGRNLVSVEKTFTTRGGKEKTRTPISKAVENVKRKAQYKQELKQGKAYFGGFEGESASDIASTKSSLKKQIKDAVNCHFEEDKLPKIIHLHYTRDEVFAL